MFSGIPVPVGGGQDGAVREQLNTRVGGVPAFLVVGDADQVLAGAPLGDVPVAADLGGPVALAWHRALGNTHP